MKIVKPSYRIITRLDNVNLDLKELEIAARTCYKSEIKDPNVPSEQLIRSLIKNGHDAMLEFGPTLHVIFTVDRGISHELVRHRHCSFAQESTRYCNYSKDKFGEEIRVIKPNEIPDSGHEYNIWKRAMESSETAYFDLLDLGVKPENARSVLPTGLKTEINVKTNIREWRLMFKLRTAPDAHPDIRYIMGLLLMEFQSKIPIVFDDLNTPF